MRGALLGLALTALSCGPRGVPTKEPRQPRDPGWCVSGRLKREVVEFCAEKRRTCRKAQKKASRYGTALELRSVGRCHREPR